MKKLLVISSLFILSANNLLAKTLIVSDVDDTIKVTNVLNKAEAVYNGLFSTRAFSGMSTLYSAMDKNDTTIFYVSGSPEVIRSKITNLLTVNKFPQKGNLILKSEKQDTFQYKFTNISNLIKKMVPDNVILIGDDTEKDPEIYEALSKAFPSQVKSMHIRLVRNRELPKNDKMNGFFSSAEVAGREFLNGTIDAETVTKTAKVFSSEKDRKSIFIEHRYCPETGRLEIEELKQKVTSQAVSDSLENVQNKIEKVCAK